MIDPQIVQTIIQGGAVGLMLVTLIMGYRIARLAIDKVSIFVNNHLFHLTEAIQEQTEVAREMGVEIKNMSTKLGNGTVRQVQSEGWELRD